MLSITVKELRAKTGMSQKAFAEYFGIPIRTVQDWEQGNRKPPSYVVEMLGRVLDNEYFDKND